MGNFKKMYMRPNLRNNGDVPALPSLCECPDIWLSGDEPVAGYQQVLATPESYANQCASGLIVNKNNYIYVRGKNGGAGVADSEVTLYYADGAVIQWPSYWLGNVIPTDTGSLKANINGVKPGEVGVVDNPFMWKKVPPYVGNCHYCLIAQFNDKNNTNPVPKVSSSIDMAKLVQNNLQWGWRNVTTMESKDNTVWTYETKLEVPSNIEDETRSYLLFLEPKNIPAGCEVSFICSKSDADNKLIKMERTVVVGDGQILGCRCRLEPGFLGMVSISLHNPKHLDIPLNIELNFEADYYTNVSELEAHDAMFLHDPNYTRKVLCQLNLADELSNGAIVRLGGYTGVIGK